MTRDELGRIVREAWVRWARKQPSPKPSWLVPYDELSEADKEADRQIGEAVSAAWAELARSRAAGANAAAGGAGASLHCLADEMCFCERCGEYDAWPHDDFGGERMCRDCWLDAIGESSL